MASKPQPPGKTVNIRPPQTAPQPPSPESQPPNSKLQTASRKSQPQTADPRQNRKVQPSPNCAPAPKPQLPKSRPSPMPQAPAPDHKPQPQIANGKPQAPSPKPQISDRHGASSPTRKIPTSDLQLAMSQPQGIDRKIPTPNHSSPNRSSPTVDPTVPPPAPMISALPRPLPCGRFSTTPHPTCRAVSPFYPPAVVCYKSFSHVIHMVRFSELPSDFLYCFAHMVYNNT